MSRWFIAASATVAGSTLSFVISRSFLKKFVHRLIEKDKRFAALALTLKHDGLKLLIMIRLCPLPYSLSNGAIATFPTVHWFSYALATAIVSPKLMLHIFVGAQIEKLADSGGKMDPKTKALSYISIIIGVVAGVATGWIMYRKTKARARELEAEEREGVRRRSIEDLESEYADDPDALEAAEALREAEDDISLRSGWGDDEYHDDPSDIEDSDGPNNVFKSGDGDEEESIGGK
jgi:membrane protein DedA with SNARE-associated domain